MKEYLIVLFFKFLVSFSLFRGIYYPVDAHHVTRHGPVMWHHYQCHLSACTAHNGISISMPVQILK